MQSSVHLSGLQSCHNDEATRTSTSKALKVGEGKTLLIMESEEEASVDLFRYQSRDSLHSDEGNVSWLEEQLSYFFDKCQKRIPASKKILTPLTCQSLGKGSPNTLRRVTPRRNKLDHYAIKFSLTKESAMKIDNNTLVFIMDVKANNHQIKQAVRKRYDNDMARVNTLIRPNGEKKEYVPLALDIANQIEIL
ncbi:60S ribosomal protein L23a [Fukomys damarensis]|uniref:60S ribosomal protein L23a n=1 Tax=Fukomys damarensis TaxID=885580 RepID=A0A091D923_FUKDA|nr:60S ribosomal protein L23a [Fukomys damarensis]